MADLSAEQLETSRKNLAAGCSANYDRAKVEGFGARVDVPPERRFVGLDAYQKAIASGVDMVILATPPGFRPIHYAAAVAAGKHVFMEKPCCIDAPGFRTPDGNQQAGRREEPEGRRRPAAPLPERAT